ncbi:MAG: hypothetical protein ACT4OS_07190 [Acidimicrobiales bacterium]
MTLADLAGQITAAVTQESLVHRLVLEFLTEYGQAPMHARQGLLDPPPAPTGDQRWDAFVAALGEHLAFHGSLRYPTWTQDPQRFLDKWWFVSDTPSGRAEALVSSPASFLRRGVFIERRDLERA